MKLNASGTALLYATYLGGADDDLANKIAVDAAGSAVIAGWTSSLSFPTTAGAISRVCHIATGGNAAKAVAVDSNDNVYVAGQTGSIDFPTVSAFVANRPGILNGFVAKIADTTPPPLQLHSPSRLAAACRLLLRVDLPAFLSAMPLSSRTPQARCLLEWPSSVFARVMFWSAKPPFQRPRLLARDVLMQRYRQP